MGYFRYVKIQLDSGDYGIKQDKSHIWRFAIQASRFFFFFYIQKASITLFFIF